MKTINFVIITLCLINSCNSNFNNSKNSNTMEKYDFELMKEFTSRGVLDTVIKRGDTLIFVNSMTESGSFYNEYPPAPTFYHVVKVFYPNGILKHKGKYIRNIEIGIWQDYDEKGRLLKEEDEDRKFGRIKLDWILKFIEKEGWIDLKTGRGREEIVYTSSDRGYIKNGIFTLGFFKKGEYPHKFNDYPLWVIIIEDCPETGFIETVYEIHGDTGEVLSKKSEQIFRKE